MEDYLSQQNKIFEDVVIEEGFPGEETITEITTVSILSQEDKDEISCTCADCLSYIRRQKILMIHKTVPSKYMMFAEAMETKTVKALKRIHKETATEYSDAIKNLRQNLNKLNNVQDKEYSLVKKEINTILEENQKANETIEKLAKKVAEHRAAIELVSIGKIRGDILELLQHKDVVSITELGNSLAIKVKEINLANTILGPFQIIFYSEGEVSVERTENSSLSKGGYWHPHVDTTGRVCFGSALGRANKILTQNRLLGRFMFIHGLLSGYNSQSPYDPIEKWAPSFCGNCNEPLKGKKAKKCSCGAALCSKCIKANKTNCCGKKVCPSCSTKCNNCQSIICDNLLYTKESLIINGCASCSKEGCSLCIMCCDTCNLPEFLCKDCSFYCETCRISQCKNCANTEEIEPGVFKYICKQGHENIISRNQEEKIQTISMEGVGEIPEQEEVAGPRIIIRSVGAE